MKKNLFWKSDQNFIISGWGKKNSRLNENNQNENQKWPLVEKNKTSTFYAETFFLLFPWNHFHDRPNEFILIFSSSFQDVRDSNWGPSGLYVHDAWQQSTYEYVESTEDCSMKIDQLFGPFGSFKIPLIILFIEWPFIIHQQHFD